MINFKPKNIFSEIQWISTNGKSRGEVLNEVAYLFNVNFNDTEGSKKLNKRTKTSISNSYKKGRHNCALFVSDFKGLSSDTELINRIDNSLDDSENMIFVVRGTMDNPEFFKELKTFKHIVFVPDYTVVSVQTSLSSTPINVLCIGGGISVDRSWRIKHRGSKLFKSKTLYYDNEQPTFDEDIFNEIIKDKNLDINIVVSVMPISFVGNDPFTCNLNWFEHDEKLKDDILSSRGIFDKIFTLLKANDKNLTMWFYSDGSKNDKFTNIFDTVFVSESSLYHFDNSALNVVRRLKSKNEKPRSRSPLQALINGDDAVHAMRRRAFVAENRPPVVDDAMELLEDAENEFGVDETVEEAEDMNVHEADPVAHYRVNPINLVWDVVHRDDNTATMTTVNMDNVRFDHPFDGFRIGNN